MLAREKRRTVSCEVCKGVACTNTWGLEICRECHSDWFDNCTPPPEHPHAPSEILVAAWEQTSKEFFRKRFKKLKEAA